MKISNILLSSILIVSTAVISQCKSKNEKEQDKDSSKQNSANLDSLTDNTPIIEDDSIYYCPACGMG